MRTTGLCVKPGANGTDAGAWGVAGGPTEPTGTDVLSEQVLTDLATATDTCRRTCLADSDCKGYSLAVSVGNQTVSSGKSMCKTFKAKVTTGRVELLQKLCNNGAYATNKRCPETCACRVTSEYTTMNECQGFDRTLCLPDATNPGQSCNECLDTYSAECFAVGLG